MSKAHRSMLRECNNTVRLLYRKGGMPWRRAQIHVADCSRRGASFFGGGGYVLPKACLMTGYKGPLRKIALGATS